jgi:hypothetical protein
LGREKPEAMNIGTKWFLLYLFSMLCRIGEAQTGDMPDFRSAQLEDQAEKKDAEPEDDDYEMDLEQYGKHPLNLNATDEETLTRLHLLNALQISNFFSYRKLLGPLLSIHELQAVPGWDLETIRRLIPYIMIGRDESVYSALRERWKGGDATYLVRAAQVLEKSRGFEEPATPGAAHYLGSPQKIFIRYTYNYKQLLAFGFTGDKDAGEPFFSGAQRYGFDFYSFHFFLQQRGILRALAVGDFTVNLGQGLMQWQTISFTKSSQALAIKREASCLRPYHSAGEFNFHRGLGLSLQKGKWQSTLFISDQKISTSLDADTVGREDLFTSFQNSGYHRTATENADRDNSEQFSLGGNLRYSEKRFLLGINVIHFHFSRPFQKRDEPYNLYSLKGRRLTDYGLDYNFTTGNLHLFGEFALDQWMHPALVQGALISLAENMDMSFLYRNISPAYQSLYSDAFTENSVPNNEKGLYTGVSCRLLPGLKADMYFDLYISPWLKYRVDGPSGGRDIFFQLVWQPGKSYRLVTLYKNEMKTENGPLPNNGIHQLIVPVKQRWRIESGYAISRQMNVNCRMEFLWIDSRGTATQKGYMGAAGFDFKKPGYSGSIGVVLFETDSYDSRLYAYEPDLLYNFSLPMYYGKGSHYYINLHHDFSRLIPHAGKHFHLSGWIKWDQTFYPGYASIGSGLDQITGNRKSELKLQLLIAWQQ